LELLLLHRWCWEPLEAVTAAVLVLLLGCWLSSELRRLAVGVIGALMCLWLRCIEQVLAHRLASESGAHYASSDTLERVRRIVDPVLRQIDLDAISTVQQIVARVATHVNVLAPQQLSHL